MPRRDIVRAVVDTVSEHCRPGDAILDLSCGEGAVLAELHQRGFHAEGTHYREGDYILRDPWPILKQATIHAGVDLGQPLPFPDNAYRAVLATEVFEHLPEHPALLREIGRVLAPGGVFVFTTPNVHTLGARLVFLFSGMLPMRGARLGWHVPPEELYSTHHHPVDLAIFHTQLRHAGLSELCLFFTKPDELSVCFGFLAPAVWLGTWLGCRRYLRDHRQGGRELLRLLRSPATLFSAQLCGVTVKSRPEPEATP